MTKRIWNPKLKYEPISFEERAAKRALGCLDKPDIEMSSIQVTSGLFIELRHTAKYKSGKKKGKTMYLNLFGSITISPDQVDAEKKLFKEETGRCPVCQGNGLVWTAWSNQEGHGYKPCMEC